jgi:hypothetical protein
MLHNRKSQGKEIFNLKKNVPQDLGKVNALTTKPKYSVLRGQINCRFIAIKNFPCESDMQVKMTTHSYAGKYQTDKYHKYSPFSS